mgnify:CR=1 FL=1
MAAEQYNIWDSNLQAILERMVTKDDLNRLEDRLESRLEKSFSDKVSTLEKGLSDRFSSLEKSLSEKIDRSEEALNDKLERSEQALNDKIERSAQALNDKIDRTEQSLKIWVKSELHWVKVCMIAGGITIPILATILLTKYFA